MSGQDGATQRETISGVVSNPVDAFGTLEWVASVLCDKFQEPFSGKIQVDVIIEFREVSDGD